MHFSFAALITREQLSRLYRDPLTLAVSRFFSHRRPFVSPARAVLSFSRAAWFCLGITYTPRSKFFTRSRPSPKIEINFTQCVRASPRAYLNIAKLYHTSRLFPPSPPPLPPFLPLFRAGSFLVNLGLLATWRGTDVCMHIYFFFLRGIRTFKSW